MTPATPSRGNKNQPVTPRRRRLAAPTLPHRWRRWWLRAAEKLLTANTPLQLAALALGGMALLAVYPLLLQKLGLAPLVRLSPLGLLAGFAVAWGAIALGLPHLGVRLLPWAAAWLGVVLGVLAGVDPLAFRFPALVLAGWMGFLRGAPWGAGVTGYVAAAAAAGWWFSPGEGLLVHLLAEAALALPLAMLLPFRHRGAGRPALGARGLFAALQDQTTPASQVEGYKQSLRRAQDIQGMYRVLLDQLDGLIGKNTPGEAARRLVRTAAHFMNASEVYLFIRHHDPRGGAPVYQGWRVGATGGEVRELAFGPDTDLGRMLEGPLKRLSVDDPAAAALPLSFVAHQLVLLEPFTAQDMGLKGFYALGYDGDTRPAPQEKQMLAHLGVLTATALESTLLRGRLHAEARTDALTGLLNRRAFTEMVARETRLSQRHNTPLTLCLLDVDHFKAVNDTHGHGAGDRVLAGLGAMLREDLRTTDVIGRLGGEEFALVLPGAALPEARLSAERLRQHLSQLTFFNDEGEGFHVTASFGMAHFSPDLGFDQWLATADKALYQAKQTGRNRVVCAGATGEDEEGQHTA